jgi:hypothetical protein
MQDDLDLDPEDEGSRALAINTFLDQNTLRPADVVAISYSNLQDLRQWADTGTPLTEPLGQLLNMVVRFVDRGGASYEDELQPWFINYCAREIPGYISPSAYLEDLGFPEGEAPYTPIVPSAVEHQPAAVDSTPEGLTSQPKMVSAARIVSPNQSKIIPSKHRSQRPAPSVIEARIAPPKVAESGEVVLPPLPNIPSKVSRQQGQLWKIEKQGTKSYWVWEKPDGTWASDGFPSIDRKDRVRLPNGAEVTYRDCVTKQIENKLKEGNPRLTLKLDLPGKMGSHHSLDTPRWPGFNVDEAFRGIVSQWKSNKDAKRFKIPIFDGQIVTFDLKLSIDTSTADVGIHWFLHAESKPNFKQLSRAELTRVKEGSKARTTYLIIGNDILFTEREIEIQLITDIADRLEQKYFRGTVKSVWALTGRRLAINGAHPRDAEKKVQDLGFSVRK